MRRGVGYYTMTTGGGLVVCLKGVTMGLRGGRRGRDCILTLCMILHLGHGV